MADTETPTTESTETAATERPLSLLAQETFGHLYHGEVPEEPEAAEETEEPEEAQEATEEPEGHEPEETSEEAPETEEETISSLQELIEHQQWDPDWVQTLKVPVKVDGETSEVSLQDLVNNHQMNQAAEKRLEEAKAKRDALTKELTEQSEALQARYATAAKLMEQAETLLEKDTAAIDWKRLREEDPAEYSAKKAEIAERRQEIEKLKQGAAEEVNKATEAQREQMRQARQQYLAQEHQALLEHLPEWRNDEKAAEEKAQLSRYLIDQGFAEQDVQAASDHRLILLARKAMLYDHGQQRADVARKKVAKVPKVMRPGAPKPKADINRQKVDQSRTRLRKTGSVDAAFDYLKAKRGG